MGPRPTSAIGVFDSGLGGLTVVKEIHACLPHENLIYVGDTARVPYGTKSPETIRRYSSQIALFLMKKKVKAIVVACNSASSVALGLLKRFPVPVLGVIGTQATVNSGAYKKAIKSLNKQIHVFEQACPLFVPLVEEGRLRGKIAESVAAHYLRPLIQKKIDTLVLGCTHYPLLKQTLKKSVGRKIQLIDSAYETAGETLSLLKKEHLLRHSSRKGRLEFYTTDSPKTFTRLGKKFLGSTIRPARYLPLERLS